MNTAICDGVVMDWLHVAQFESKGVFQRIVYLIVTRQNMTAMRNVKPRS